MLLPLRPHRLVVCAIGCPGIVNQQVAFYVLSDSATYMAVGIEMSLLSIGLVFWFVKSQHYDGLARANSIDMMINMVALMLLLQRKIGPSLGVITSMDKIAVAAGVICTPLCLSATRVLRPHYRLSR